MCQQQSSKEDTSTPITEPTEIEQSETKRSEDLAYLTVWDFAGEQVFYNTHHIFLSTDCIYLVVFKLPKCLTMESPRDKEIKDSEYCKIPIM